MDRKLLLTALVIALCLPQLAAAQLGRWDTDSSQSLGDLIRDGEFRPFIEVNYGFAKPRYEGLDDSFNTLGIAEIKLGFAETEQVRKALVSLDEFYAFGSYLGEDIRPGDHEDDGDVRSELVRFGAGNRLGYGYGWKAATLELYNQNSLNWTKLTPVSYDDLDAESAAVFDRYGDQFRFGQLFEAGAKIRVARSFSVTAGLEGAVVFPRFVFWPWLGSAMLYSGVQGGIQYFTEAITETSPVFGPLLHFALKSGVSYAYYMFSREDMNWPFESETPLTIESFKLGAAITF